MYVYDRVSTRGVLGRQIDSSWWNILAISHFQPVLHNWCNKGHGMFYPVYGMMHIKDPLLLFGKGSPCGSSRFPALLNGPLPFVRCNVMSASLNKTCHSLTQMVQRGNTYIM